MDRSESTVSLMMENPPCVATCPRRIFSSPGEASQKIWHFPWKFRKSNSPYSAYGYEAYEIKKKLPLNEFNNEHTITFGHEVNEYNAKRIIQLTIVAMVDKKAAKLLQPTIEYLHHLENL